MDIKALDKTLQEIARKRNELQKLNYNNPKYDELEEELHDIEDKMHEKYGAYLEGILQEVHDKYCPDTDVLFPVAYLAKTYIITGNDFSVSESEGVFVEVDEQPGKETKLVIVPSPPRVILNGGKEKQQVLWTAK